MDRILTAKPISGDSELDSSLRPRRLEAFVGQDALKDNLSVMLQAARLRGEAPDHILLYGPPGLGKTTLAHIVAEELGVPITVTSGPLLTRAGDAAVLLRKLSRHQVLFIDEIHRLPRPVEEVLYSAMEDFVLDIMFGKGKATRSVSLKLPPFTLVGATTRPAVLTSPLRNRFGVAFRLNFYSAEELMRILERSAAILGVEADGEALLEIARRSRGTPRIANRLLRRVRDFAQVKADGRVTPELAREALHRLGVDEAGLDEVDRRILSLIIENYGGGPVGLDTLAAAVGEETDTIMDVYEPYLLQAGFLQRTNRGRIVTELAYRHLGIYPLRDDRPMF